MKQPRVNTHLPRISNSSSTACPNNLIQELRFAPFDSATNNQRLATMYLSGQVGDTHTRSVRGTHTVHQQVSQNPSYSVANYYGDASFQRRGSSFCVKCSFFLFGLGTPMDIFATVEEYYVTAVNVSSSLLDISLYRYLKGNGHPVA